MPEEGTDDASELPLFEVEFTQEARCRMFIRATDEDDIREALEDGRIEPDMCVDTDDGPEIAYSRRLDKPPRYHHRVVVARHVKTQEEIMQERLDDEEARWECIPCQRVYASDELRVLPRHEQPGFRPAPQCPQCYGPVDFVPPDPPDTRTLPLPFD